MRGTVALSGDFEGGVHLLAKTLGINPMVFRLCALDLEAIEYVGEEYQIHRQLLIGLIERIFEF